MSAQRRARKRGAHPSFIETHDPEGIVAKRKSDPYRRGVRWWKIKNRAYSQAEGRHELFNGDWRAIARLRKKPTALRALFGSDR